MISERVVGAWEEFQAHSGGLGRPQTEEDNSKLIALLDELTDTYDCTRATLAKTLAEYFRVSAELFI
jgi:hypothetical protein